MQQRQRVRFALGERVAGDEAGTALRKADFGQQRRREPARLVGDDAPAHAGALDGGEDCVEAVEQPRVHRQRDAVEVQEPPPQRFVAFGLGLPEREAQQPRRAMRDERADLRKGRASSPSAIAQAIECCGHVRRRVEQRPVEVEQDAAQAAAPPSCAGSHHRATKMRQVVDGYVGRHARVAAEWVVVESREVGELESGVTRPARQFRRPDQARVAMRAHRQEAQQVFGADDGEGEGLGVAVDRRAR